MEVLTATPLDALQSALVGADDEAAPTALQCTVAAAKDAVTRALEKEGVARDAALSLAQRERLADLCRELEAAEHVLSAALTERGRCIAATAAPRPTRLRDRLRRRPPHAPLEWDEALGYALESLESGATFLSSLASGQPPTTAARQVAEAAAALLVEHHETLKDRYRRWHR